MQAEVFVVDNNSVDGSCAMVHEKFPQTILIENKDNPGFSKANNQGIKLSKGEYVLLLNPDTLVEEDTFTSTVNFMDAHSDAGGLGVYMIDGKGNFLPESKRGLPSPSVAFYKIFGLSALFPKSKLFGRYHLGFLDKNQIHEVDVLSGAFMLMRKSVLDKVGLLDETFFMYGEDIDLSYRITQGGYKNYYFPETKIIHYKGESTKKTSVNYVRVFYKAMVIFARKHFNKQHAWLFGSLINFAVYLRALMAVAVQFLKRIAIPLLDSLIMYGGYIALKYYWELKIKVFHYPSFYETVIIPVYVLCWLIGIYLAGGYDKPVRYIKVIRGITFATIAILVVYALMPEEYRFSRALILMGTLWSAGALVVYRWICQVFKIPLFSFAGNIKKRVVIVGGETECQRILLLLQNSNSNFEYVGFTDIAKSEVPQSNQNPNYLGDYKRLQDICEVYKIDEVIFSSKDIPSQNIISTMRENAASAIEYKIAPEESSYIIGSNSIHSQGSLYFVEMNTLNRIENIRNKRIFDYSFCLLLLLTCPLQLLVIKNPIGLLKNIFKVLFKNTNWVGPDYNNNSNERIHKSILHPSHQMGLQTLDNATIDRLNMLYAKNFNIEYDINMVMKNYRMLGSV